jgi:hypothetical protein
VNADAGGEVVGIAELVGTLIAIGETRIAHVDIEGLSGLQREQRGELPAADECIESAIHIRADHSSPPYWQLEHSGDGDAVGGIVGARGPLGFEVIHFLRESVGESADEVIRSGG